MKFEVMYTSSSVWGMEKLTWLTSWLIKKCIYEQMKDFRNGDNRNTFVKNNLETKHSFNFKDSKMFVNMINNTERLLNLAFFSNTKKVCFCFFTLSLYSDGNQRQIEK